MRSLGWGKDETKSIKVQSGKAKSRTGRPAPDPSKSKAKSKTLAKGKSKSKVNADVNMAAMTSFFARRPEKEKKRELIFFNGMTGDQARAIWLRVCFALFLATAMYGIVEGGHMQRVSQMVTSNLDKLARDIGFGITSVTIVGQGKVPDKDIVRALQLDQSSILSFDTQKARLRVETIPWVRKAEVMKIFPATVKVTIEERKPYAVWQNSGQFFLIDTEGVVVTPIKVSEKGELPLIIGQGAADDAKTFFAELQAHPVIAKRLHAAFRVGKRRWTLKLDNGLEIFLPEKDMAAAMTELERLESQYKLFSMNIVHVDLRIADRITLRQSSGASPVKLPEAQTRSGA